MSATTNDTFTLFASTALQQGQAFQPSTSDSFTQKAWKFTAGTALTTSAFCLAIVETALLAILSIASYPVSFISLKSYSKMTSRLAHSTQNIALAARYAFGAEIERSIPQKNPQLSREKRNKASFFTPMMFYKKHQKSLVAGAIATIALSAYYFGLFEDTHHLVASKPEPAPSSTLVTSITSSIKTPDLSNRNISHLKNEDTIIEIVIAAISVPIFAAWPLAFFLV